MAQWISFKTIKEQVTIEQILEHYGLLKEAKRKGNELRIHCPFHDDSQPSFTAHTKKNGFHCFGCGAKGNIFAFVRLKEEIDSGDTNKDDRQAAVLIADWFGVVSLQPEDAQARPGKERSQKKPAQEKREEASGAARESVQDAIVQMRGDKPALVNPPLAFAFKNLDYGHPYLAERGLTKEIIEQFGVGYHAGRGIMSGRMVIPIHNEQGELVAYAGRWPANEGWIEGEDKYTLNYETLQSPDIRSTPNIPSNL